MMSTYLHFKSECPIDNQALLQIQWEFMYETAETMPQKYVQLEHHDVWLVDLGTSTESSNVSNPMLQHKFQPPSSTISVGEAINNFFTVNRDVSVRM